MCVIFHFSPGSSFNKEQFFNAVRNNWHGYGIILKDTNNRIQVIKKYSDESDPEEIWKLVTDNTDIERFLHIRHATKGATDETNVQPFCVYSSNTRQVHFMHNGTLTGFGDAINSGASDTRDFCEKILSPSLLCWTGPNGKADYTDVNYLKLVVDKQWSYSSTGLFISNNLEPIRIGNGWSKYKHPNDDSSGDIFVSNTMYFDRIQRGPYFQRLEEERKAKEAEERKTQVVNDPFGRNHQNITGGTPGRVKTWNESGISKDPSIIRALNNIVNKWDLDDPKDLVHLNAVTYEEWLEWVDEDSQNGNYTVAAFIEHLVGKYVKLAIRNSSLEDKKKKAEKRLQEIVKKVKEDGTAEAA